MEREQRRADQAAAAEAAARGAKAALEHTVATLQLQLRLSAEQIEAGKEQLKQMVQLQVTSMR